MKMLLIVDDYLPHSIKVAAKMMHELAVEFKSRGHEVSVITPDYRIQSKLETAIIDGVTIYFFKSGRIKNVNLIVRAINEILLSFRARFYLRKIIKDNKHDLIVYYSPSIFWGPLVFMLKNKWRSPAYLVLRDIFPQWVIDNGTLSPISPITVLFKAFEKLNYKVADSIALQSPKNLLWFNDRYRNKYKTELLYNWADNKARVSTGNFRKEHYLEGKIIFFYGGNIGKAQDMGNIMRLAEKMLIYKNACFIILGDGDEVDLVKETIKLKSLSNTTLLPSVSQEEFKNILSEIDVGLFTLHRDHTTQNFPGKLLGYMAQEIPILGSINPGNDLKDILEKYDAGLISINGDDDMFFQNAMVLLNDNDRRRNIGNNANRLLSELFSVESAADFILREYRE